MPSLQNPWVGYTTRSYNQIKNSVLTRLGVSNPEVTDHSESNILVIIIGIFAGIAEMIGYYIDNVARESFISTARRYSSMVKLVKLVDYRIKAANPASVDLLLTFDNPATGAYTILAGTEFQTTNAIKFIAYADVDVEIGDTSVNVGVIQHTEKLAVNLGNTTGILGQLINLPLNYSHDTLTFTINGILWVRQNTLAFSLPTDTHFIVNISINKIPFIEFGDNINGAIPPGGFPIIADYFETQGADGNVDPNTIVTLNTAITIPGVTNITTTNNQKAVAGSGVESLDRIKRAAPLSIRTLDRAVTRQDYADVTLLAPGVDKSSVHFTCGKLVTLYVTPVGGGIAQSLLLLSTCAFVEERKMITTFLGCEPAGETYLDVQLDVTANFRQNGILTEADVRAAMLEEYSYDRSDINKPIRRSDIIALVDNLDKVDFLTLTVLSTKPYARPYQHLTALNWNRKTNNSSIANGSWRIIYTNPGFVIYHNNVFLGNITIGVPYTDPNNIITLTILTGSYTTGETWLFKTYPFTENIELDDFSVPILRDQDLVINVTEQVTTN